MIQEIKNACLFSIQLDESTDVQSCHQLMVFVRYVHSGDVKEEFLFCDDLELTTKAKMYWRNTLNYLKSKVLIGVFFVEYVPMGPLQYLGLDQAS